MTDGPDRGQPWSGFGTGWAITTELLSAIAVWGGIGYLADRLVGTTRVFLPVGLVLGAIGGIYLIYMRHGKGDGAER